jgi:uncharacterized protein (TIGR02611 family)
MITLKSIKRIVILVVGGTVLLLGIALLVLPGPAFIVIPAGLAILAIEFAWARRWLRKARSLLANMGSAVGQSEQARRSSFFSPRQHCGSSSNLKPHFARRVAQGAQESRGGK